MLGLEELMELEENILVELSDSLLETLTLLNRTNQLEEALKIWNLDHLLDNGNKYEPHKLGKIVVLGESMVRDDTLEMIANKAGIDKSRLVLYTDYEDAKKFDTRKLQYQTKYAAVLAGPMPHSGISKGDYDSVLSVMEQEDGYPTVIRLGSNALKITKSNFKEAINNLIEDGVIKPDA